MTRHVGKNPPINDCDHARTGILPYGGMPVPDSLSPFALGEIRGKDRPVFGSFLCERLCGTLRVWPQAFPQRHWPKTRPFREAASHRSEPFRRTVVPARGVDLWTDL